MTSTISDYSPMPSVKINGWKPGLMKVEHTKVLRAMGGMGLSEAKHMTDAVLDGNTVSLPMESDAEAEALAARLRELGALAQAEK